MAIMMGSVLGAPVRVMAALVGRRSSRRLPPLHPHEQYRHIVERATDAIVTIDQSGRIVLVNPAVTKMFGWTSSELIGQPVSTLIGDPDLLSERRRSGRSVQESTGHRKGGGEFPIEICFAEPFEGEPRTLTGFIRDATARKDAEEIRAAQSRHSAVRADVSASLARPGGLREMLEGCAEALITHLDAALAGIWVIANDRYTLELQASAGLYTDTNGRYSRVPLGELIIGTVALELAPFVTNDLANEPRVDDPLWMRAQGVVAFAGYPLVVDRRAVGVLAMFSRRPITTLAAETLADISDAIAQGIERKQAEEAVRLREAFLAEAQVLSRTGSWGWNRTTGELFWSEGLYRMFGLARDLIPTIPLVADMIHPDDRPQFDQDVETLVRERIKMEREYRVILQDGSLRYMHVVGRPSGNRFANLEFIGSVMDVTERRQAEDELDAIRSRLAEVSRFTTMGELAASIAHEVNQPLAAVVTNAQACSLILQSSPESLEALNEAISDIAEAGKRASDVISRIRLLLTKGISQPTALNLNDVVRETVALMGKDLAANRIALQTDLAASLPRVRADKIQLQQVLINLIRNAVEAMATVHDRRRTLAIASCPAGEGLVAVTVADSGTGIDPAYRDRIFDTFFTTKADSMGMGLAVCRNIVASYGGRLWATDNADGGATFRFTIPAGSPEEM